MKHLLAGILLILLTGFTLNLQAQDAPDVTNKVLNTVPVEFSYQGYLTDNADNPLSGNFDMIFRLYTASVGGSNVWSEFHTGGNAVNVSNGVYNVILGSITSLAGEDFNVPLWLQVQVEGEIQSPRTQLTAVPYAVGLKLPFEGSASSSGAVIEVENTGSGDGITVTDAGDDGLYVANAGDTGIRVNQAGEDGVFINRAGSVTSPITNAGENGIEIAGANDHGIFVGNAGSDGLYINNANSDGIYVDYAVGYSMHLKGQKNTSATLSGHVALIENNSFTNDTGPDVLALRSNPLGGQGGETNYITFFHSNTSIGRIEANTAADGIVFGTTGGDYAEYLPFLNPGESFQAGDVVGVFGGHISRNTTGADQVMVITDQAAVLGNSPEDEEDLSGYEAVSFIGQIPTRISGPVEAGNYIIASGRNDGTAIAVKPSDVTLDQVDQLVGRAWESSMHSGIKRVNIAVGLDRSEVLRHIIARQQQELDELRALVQTVLEQQTGS